MAVYMFPSSFCCDCGHESHFFERTVNEMMTDSRKRKKPLRLGDSEENEHFIEFVAGAAAVMICPKLGRREIVAEA